MLPSTTFSMQQTTHFSGARAVPNDPRNEETSSMLMLEPLPFEFDTSVSRFTTPSCNQDLLLEAITTALTDAPSSVNFQHQQSSVTPRRVSDICDEAFQIFVSRDEEDDEEDNDLVFMVGSNDFADEILSSSFKSLATPITSNELDSTTNAPSSPASFDIKKEPTKDSAAAARTSPPSNMDMTQINPTAVGRSWYQRYQELIQFKQEFGSCCVPVYWPQNPPLAQWVKRQRSQFKLRNEGRHSNMSESRVQALNQVNFIWDSHSVFWEKRLEELKQFRELHGHCRIPTQYPQNQKLAVWAKSQRRQFKLFCQGDKKSHITKERIQKLVKLGFVFTPRSTKK